MNHSIKRAISFLTLIFILFLSPAGLSADTDLNDALIHDSGRYTLKLALVGPGDVLFFWWGHIGLVVEDNQTGRARFFDWGIFDWESENFLVNFAFGRLYYYCAVVPAELYYNALLSTNRDISLYTLNLPMDKKLEIIRFAENNVLPENRIYNYHHFRDNCATRIRDIIDMAVDGQFSSVFENTPSRFTLRQQVRRHTWQSPFFDWFLSFLMGQDIDRPISAWEDMFLPSEIILRAMDFEYTGEDGITRPLISAAETMNRSQGRPIVLDEPRPLWPILLVFSVMVSLLLFIFFAKGKTLKHYRKFLGSIICLLGLFFGIAGSILFFMTFFTAHDYTYNNSNVIFINPLMLAAIPLGLFFGFSGNVKRRHTCIRLLQFLWAYIFMGGLLAMILRMLPSFSQQDVSSQALIMPIALILVVILTKLKKEMALL